MRLNTRHAAYTRAAPGVLVPEGECLDAAMRLDAHHSAYARATPGALVPEGGSA